MQLSMKTKLRQFTFKATQRKHVSTVNLLNVESHESVCGENKQESSKPLGHSPAQIFDPNGSMFSKATGMMND